MLVKIKRKEFACLKYKEVLIGNNQSRVLLCRVSPQEMMIDVNDFLSTIYRQNFISIQEVVENKLDSFHEDIYKEDTPATYTNTHHSAYWAKTFVKIVIYYWGQ